MPEAVDPFDDIRALLAQLPAPSVQIRQTVRARETALAKAPGALGRLEEMAEWLAVWQNRAIPRIDRPFSVLFAANNGVAARIAQAGTLAAVRHKLELCAAGGAAVNQIAASHGIGLKVFELALDHPTADIATAPALDEKAAAATFAFGMEAVAGEPDLLCLGAFGRCNDLVAAAVFAALWGGEADHWLDDDHVSRQEALAVLELALNYHREHLTDPLAIMRRLGGRETSALAGAIIAARLQHTPVVLDGLADCAAAAILQTLEPSALDHCVAGHVAAGSVHARVLERLDKRPVLDLGIRMAEGAGAALAAGILKTAAACHNDMATWEQANIPQPG